MSGAAFQARAPKTVHEISHYAVVHPDKKKCTGATIQHHQVNFLWIFLAIETISPPNMPKCEK